LEGLIFDFDASLTQFAGTQINFGKTPKRTAAPARWISTLHRE